MGSLFVAFVAVTILLAVSPGPDMAVVTRNALLHGRRGVLLSTSGVALGIALWIIATAFGLAAILKASSLLFIALKVVGGSYLAYLGVRAWIASFKKPDDVLRGAPAAPAGSAFRQGFLSAATNPKLGVLFVTLLPQFVEPRRALLPQLLFLGATFALIGLTWLNLYGLLVARLRDVVTGPRVRRWMDRVTGTVLVGLGLRLALERT